MPGQTTDPPSTQQTLTLQEAVDLALQNHTAGELSKAEEIYKQILKADPDQPQVLHLLGMITHQRGGLCIHPLYYQTHLYPNKKLKHFPYPVSYRMFQTR